MPINPLLKRATGAAAAFAATAAIGLAAAGPAAADTQKHEDPRGDVQTLDAKAPKPGIDVISLTNTFKGKKLTLSMTTVKLLKKGYAAEWLIDAGDAGSFVLIYDHTTGQPDTQFFSLGGPIRRPVALHRGTPPTCNGVKATAKNDTVIGSVPRSCLGGADAVRIAGLTVLPGDTTKVDDSRQKGFGDVSDIKFGPKLKRN